VTTLPFSAARRQLIAATAGCALASAAGSQRRWPYATLNGQPPLVIAHRGASGDRPEHTLAAHELAIEQGADFIEPDLVVTGDGALVVRHENELSLSTDVASRPRFASKRRTQRIDGREITGWFSEDFLLAEIRELRATERFAQARPRNAEFDGRLGIATLDEVIALAAGAGGSGARRVGIYPELKHAAHFDSAGLAVEKRLAEALRADAARALPVFVQSFELPALRRFAEHSDAPRVLLLARPLPPAALRDFASQVQAIGVAKSLVFPRDAAGAIGEATALVAEAHALGLALHAWTFRNEDAFLPANLRGRPRRELELAFATGIDGVFTDFPDTAVAVRESLLGAAAPADAKPVR
jgi:glycerophosphoryl diester phosphodiesterase